jgi:peptide/nickel transport system substrate-binding protein
VNPAALLDVRVRRALAHSIDKHTINENLFEGVATITDTWIPPTEAYYPDVERVVPRYPFDTRRAEQLMGEIGLARDAARFYLGPNQARLNVEISHLASKTNDTEGSILADGWRHLGLEVSETSLTPAQGRDNELQSTFRSLFTSGGGRGAGGLEYLTSTSIPGPSNRWIGQNRGGWSNAEYDHLVAANLVTLDRSERVKQIVEAARILNEDLGVIPLYYSAAVLAYATGVQGINVKSVDADWFWNVYEWSWSV